MIKHLTEKDFHDTIQSEKPVLVDFWASWCGPCRMIAPYIEELSEEYEGKAIVCKVDVDDQIKLAEQYRVMSIPSVFVFQKGEMKEHVVGVRSKQDFADMIDRHI